MIYFSTIPVLLESVEPDQHKALREFKEQLRQRGLYEEYESPEAFREKLTRQLAQTVLRHFTSKKNGDGQIAEETISRPKLPKLSETAKRLLIEASQDKDGKVYKSRSMHGLSVQTGDKNLVDNQGART